MIVRVNPDLTWTIETRGLALHAPGEGSTRTLPYPAAALWDLITRGGRSAWIWESFAAIAGVELETARRLAATLIDEWIEYGWLRSEDTHDPK